MPKLQVAKATPGKLEKLHLAGHGHLMPLHHHQHNLRPFTMSVGSLQHTWIPAKDVLHAESCTVADSSMCCSMT